MIYFYFSEIPISVLLQNKMLYAKDIKFWSLKIGIFVLAMNQIAWQFQGE